MGFVSAPSIYFSTTIAPGPTISKALLFHGARIAGGGVENIVLEHGRELGDLSG